MTPDQVKDEIKRAVASLPPLNANQVALVAELLAMCNSAEKEAE